MVNVTSRIMGLATRQFHQGITESFAASSLLSLLTTWIGSRRRCSRFWNFVQVEPTDPEQKHTYGALIVVLAVLSDSAARVVESNHADTNTAYPLPSKDLAQLAMVQVRYQERAA